MRASQSDIVTQLRAFSGELNGIAWIHQPPDAGELARLSHSADEIACRPNEASDESILDLANRVQTIAGANGDATCAARLLVAASVLSDFVRRH